MTDMNETIENEVTPEEEFTDFASEEFDETFEFEPVGDFDDDRPGEEDEDFGDAEHVEDPKAWEGAAEWPLESWGKFSPRTNPTHPAVALINTALGVEGDRFTVETVEAVNAFQETKGLKPVGNVGPVTWERLFGGETDGVPE